ncbi:hypothetical protein GCM10009552_43180 [Rothia nasimurium]|uniref:PepSY domain-containing protein n=1 Tax=Luteibacter anthropi TaxID=564369 RepID=A0A7X5ZJ58_9GAMM|nr:hypothetical protein [Luteibacter anthropi]NII07400.1 hypothetical protein [Luteibacter anthropi]
MLTLIFASFLVIGEADATPNEEGCRKMDSKFYGDHIDEVRKFFFENKPSWVGRVNESPGSVCSKEAHIYVEAKPEFNNVGLHWIIYIDMKSGEMSIVDGL